MGFRDKLGLAADRNNSLLCVGVDPHPSHVATADLIPFLRSIIDATSDLVCAYKPQLAFFEARGSVGWDALHAVLDVVPNGIPIILDAKRGDIGSTAEAYAEMAFDLVGADAITVNPYLGYDAAQPFLARPDRSAFFLCRTSNPGGDDIQNLNADGIPLFLRVADLVQEWGAPSNNSGLIVGATYPKELRHIRERCPNLTILLPGVGAQKGNLQDALAAGLDSRASGLIVSASRSILFASSGSDFAVSARREAERLRDEINFGVTAYQSSLHQ